MTIERLKEIFSVKHSCYDGDNIRNGVEILRRYIPENYSLIIGASESLVHFVYAEDLIKWGLDEHDAISLRNFEFFLYDDALISLNI